MRELVSKYLPQNMSVDMMLKQALILGKLEKEQSVEKILTTVLNNQLVMEPRTAHIGKYSSYDNITNTAYFLAASTYAPKFMKEHQAIYENMQRWIAEQKKNGLR